MVSCTNIVIYIMHPLSYLPQKYDLDQYYEFYFIKHFMGFGNMLQHKTSNYYSGDFLLKTPMHDCCLNIVRI